MRWGTAVGALGLLTLILMTLVSPGWSMRAATGQAISGETRNDRRARPASRAGRKFLNLPRTALRATIRSS